MVQLPHLEGDILQRNNDLTRVRVLSKLHSAVQLLHQRQKVLIGAVQTFSTYNSDQIEFSHGVRRMDDLVRASMPSNS